MERDDLVQLAERELLEAEQAYRADPSDDNRRRITKAWLGVQDARGEPFDTEAPFPFLAPRTTKDS